MNLTARVSTLLMCSFLHWNANHVSAQEPSKEALITTLRNVYPLLAAEEYDKATEHFALPETLLANKAIVHKELAKIIKLKEISLDGIERLEDEGVFGAAVDVFGQERAEVFSKKMKADIKKCWGLKLIPAEVMGSWDGGKFKLVRLDDVGKLPPISDGVVKETPKQNLEKLLSRGLALEKEGKFSDAWRLYSEAQKLGLKDSQLRDAFDRCVSQFALVGIFEVGISKQKITQLLGEPHEKVDLGKDRQRWVYGSWGVDFRSATLHEIISLKGATAELFQPTETLSLDLDDRDWVTQFREKRKGHVVAYLYTEKYTKNWTDQITVERILYQDNVSAEEFAKAHIAREAKRSPNSKHKVLVKDDSSLTFAAEVPVREDGTALHKLVRVMKGPKDIHQITYMIRSREAPSAETQKKWLQMFLKAQLTPVAN